MKIGNFEYSPDKIFKQIEKHLKDEFGELWEQEKEHLQKWSQVIGKLLLKKAAGKGTKKTDISLEYGWIGIDALKTRLQYKVENATVRIAKNALSIILDAGLKAARIYLGKFG